MAIVRKHHLNPSETHKPRTEWPEDCMIQWGGNGVVFGKTGSYATAFFEAFPAEGGFIRGEGQTIEEAEANALEKHGRIQACSHLWGRKGYTNGGTSCRKCGAFVTHIMKPIVTIGAWCAPLRPAEINNVLSGYLQAFRPDEAPGALESKRYCRKIWLRCRAQGVDLPAIPDEVIADLFGEPTAFAQQCKFAMSKWLSDRDYEGQGARGGAIEGIFNALSDRRIRRAIETYRAGVNQNEQEDLSP